MSSVEFWPRYPDEPAISHFCRLPPANTSTLVPMAVLLSFRPLSDESQPVVLVATLVAQQHCRTVILGDQQIGRAIPVVVAGHD